MGVLLKLTPMLLAEVLISPGISAAIPVKAKTLVQCIHTHVHAYVHILDMHFLLSDSDQLTCNYSQTLALIAIIYANS